MPSSSSSVKCEEKGEKLTIEILVMNPVKHRKCTVIKIIKRKTKQRHSNTALRRVVSWELHADRLALGFMEKQEAFPLARVDRKLSFFSPIPGNFSGQIRTIKTAVQSQDS